MDEKGIQISKAIEYNEENFERKNKFIIIAKDAMLENLKSNKILQFFLDCTYKTVYLHLNLNLSCYQKSGIDQEEKKQNYAVLYYYIKKKLHLIIFLNILKKNIVLGLLI